MGHVRLRHGAFAAGRALARHRLAQFFAIGGAIFLVAPGARPERDIVVSGDHLRALAAADAARTGKPALDAARLRAIEERTVEDEVLYREGLRLGLDRDDAIVRQRVVQKVLFLAEELEGATRPPTEAELEAFHAATAERWRRPPRYHLRQLFARDRATLEGGPEGARAEPGPVPTEIDLDARQLGERLGADVAGAVAAMAPGTWSAPLASPYGWHLVQVVAIAPSDVAPLSVVRGEVAEAWSLARRQQAVAKFVERSLADYRVVVDGAPLRDFRPPERVAFRGDPSGED